MTTFKPKIAMIGIVTSNIIAMRDFYNKVLGFPIQQDLGSYVEFESEGVRFAITTNEVMLEATGHQSYSEPRSGQSLELALPIATPLQVDVAYKDLISRGATAVKAPEDKPWGQRAAFFSDPDGNIHEIFANLN